MIKHKRLILIFFIFLFTNCSSTISRSSTTLPKDRIYAVSTFWNYTETPMAGFRASTIIDGVLSNKGVKTISLIGGENEIESVKSKESFIKKKINQAKKLNADYIILGSVQEWRYKTGIDGEPVVSYSIRVIDLKDGSIAFNGVGAKSGWGHKSIGVVAQEIANSLIPKFIL